MALEILRRTSGPYRMNTYFLTCTNTRDTLIIDPGDHAGNLLAVIREKRFVPRRILSTHGHWDALFSLAEFKGHADIPYSLHEADDAFFRDETVREKTRRAVGLPPPPLADIPLRHGARIRFGSLRLEVIHTPGHTPGSSCFLVEGCLFTGDTLFVGEAGRTDLPGGDLDRLIGSIRDRILPLPLSTRLFPGHHHTGTPYESSLEREMAENIYITDFILDS